MNASSSTAIDSAWQRLERRARDESGSFEALALLAESLNLAPDVVQIAVEIASFETTLAAREHDALIALVLVVLAALEDGSTRFPVTGDVGRGAVMSMLRALADTMLGIDAPARFATEIERLLEANLAATTIAHDEDHYKPLLYRKPFVYMRKLRVTERAAAARLRAMLQGEPAPRFDSGDAEWLAADVCAKPIATQKGAVLLSGAQRAAVAGSMRSRLTLVSGGPGTGKTSIVIAILRLMVALGVDPHAIALAAPTGKAANRIGECIAHALTTSANTDATDRALYEAALEPTTLHRLLGYSPSTQRFRHHRNNPLAAQVVIVDEGSMLDLSLMERLVSAIGDATRLIILGDADQLPSVAAGAVFRELLPSASASNANAIDRSCFRLKENYRTSASDSTGGSILSVANRINGGDTNIISETADGASAVRRISVAKLAFSGVEYLASSRQVARGFLNQWYADRVIGNEAMGELRERVYVEGADGFDADDVARMRQLFALVAASRILTVTRAFDTGAVMINQWMHRRASAAIRGSERLVPGEPVLVIANDYERMLFNGDTGLVLRVRRKDAGAASEMAVFPRRDNFVAFRLDLIRDSLELAYAMTVHKAQGSEFDSVALILPEKKIPLLTREIVYTAVSRARRSVVILGDEGVLADAIAAPATRYSGLRELLTES